MKDKAFRGESFSRTQELCNQRIVKALHLETLYLAELAYRELAGVNNQQRCYSTKFLNVNDDFTSCLMSMAKSIFCCSLSHLSARLKTKQKIHNLSDWSMIKVEQKICLAQEKVRHASLTQLEQKLCTCLQAENDDRKRRIRR